MDISYEIGVKDRRFEAAFYQLTDSDKDTTGFAQWAIDYVVRNYSEEERQNMTDEQSQVLLIEVAVAYAWQKASHRSVWFYIEKKSWEYRIVLFYDNERNRSNGGDL